MNGEEIRDTWFSEGNRGYDSSEVDNLLRRVAAELDVGRPAGPLIENARFRVRMRSWRYDIDAVDWFLGQFLLHHGHSELAGMTADPWRALPVTQFTRVRGSDAVRLPAKQRRKLWKSFSEECSNAWRDFGQLPGVRLTWGQRRGRLSPLGYRELRTAERQTIASRERGFGTEIFRAGGRSFTKERKVPDGTTAGSWPAGSAELAARSSRDWVGHFAAVARSNWGQKLTRNLTRNVGISEFVDGAGSPILCSHGDNEVQRACAGITFPDQRWLRFLIRGTRSDDAIMTAVDQAGNRVARYRTSGSRVEIIVNPNQKLTDELVLAIAISAPWLASYFYP